MNNDYLDPEREVFQQLRELDQTHPVDMLNLVKLNKQANYNDGRLASGADAYTSYGRESGPIFRKVGGKIIWSGDPQHMVIGPQDEAWDIAFIARYPTGQAFLDMVYDPDYQAVVFHRQAAVKTSRLIRHRSLEAGVGFG